MKRTNEMEIDEVVIQPSKIQPIIVNFKNGKLKDDETKKIECGLYVDEKQQKKVLALSNGDIVYKGYRPDLNKDSTWTMLAIFNKKTGKVKLVQAERWDVMPVLDREIFDGGTDDNDKHALLNKQFGSKKAKRKTELYERMQVNADTVKDHLEKTVANIEIEPSELEPMATDDFINSSYLPTCNREATSVSDVYNIYEIVPKNILDTLNEESKYILENGAEGKCSFFEKTLAKYKSDSIGIDNVSVLLYIEGVCKWLKLPMKFAKKNSNEICSSVEAKDYIIDTYSQQSAHGRLRPNTMKDKGVVHCLVMALVISNYVLDLESFSTILGIRTSIKKLTELARLIGAVPLKDDKKRVVLKLPLPTQSSILSIKKGKRK